MNENGLAQAIQDIEQAVQTGPVTEIPALLGILEGVKAFGWARLFTEPQKTGPGESTKKNALTAEEVARMLNVKPSFVYEQAREKKLKSYKVGRYIRFKETAVNDYLAKGGA